MFPDPRKGRIVPKDPLSPKGPFAVTIDSFFRLDHRNPVNLPTKPQTLIALFTAVGILLVSLAFLILSSDQVSSCTIIIPGQPYTCGTPTIIANPPTTLAFGVLTALGALALGAGTFMLLTFLRNNRTTSPTDKKPLTE